MDATGLESVVYRVPENFSALRVAISGPAKACRLLELEATDCAQWLCDSRLAAIAGSCPRSHAEIRSAVRAYSAFALKVRRIALPPTVDMLLSWSCLFRCSGTFKNYLSNLRTACQLASISTDAMHDRTLAKAARAIDKRRGYIARQPMFIGMELMQRIMQQVSSDCSFKVRCAAMAFLTTYVFLLRMPSECLPIRVAADSAAVAAHQAVVSVTADALTLRLKRRKNRDGGSVLTRKCWCAKCNLTCPVHVLGPFFQHCGVGSQPFGFIDARSSLVILRSWLQHFKVEHASQYRTHDIRRGHARDLQRGGATLREILIAGEWRSAAFLSYLDQGELECSATLEAHIAESSDEEVERVGGQ